MSNGYRWAPSQRHALEVGRLSRFALIALLACTALLGWSARASAVTFASKPFADNRPGTTMRDVVVRGSDNHVWLKTFNSTNWNGWLDLGGDVRGRPTSISFGQNHLDIFARDSTNHLMHRWWNGTSFSNWEAIGGAWQFVGDPIPVSWSNGRIDIFARGTDNALLHLYTAGGGWSNWESLGGSLGYDPAVDTAGANNLDIFAVDPNGLLAHKYFFGQWSTWQPLGAFQYTSAPTAATTGLRAGVFARGTDAAMDAVWWMPAGWGGPFGLGSPGGITGQPSAITFGDPIIAVFARGQADNRLYQMWYNGANNTWNGWGNVGGPWVMSTDPYAIAWGGNSEDVFAIGNDGSLIHTWFDGTAWHAWENLDHPYTTSIQYGGADQSINTTSEATAAMAAIQAMTAPAAAAAWQEVRPADQVYLTPSTGFSTGSVDLGPLEAPYDNPNASAASLPDHGCRDSRNSNKVRAKQKWLPDYDVATVTLVSRFCWHMSTHTVELVGTPTLQVVFTANGNNFGWTIEKSPDLVNYMEPWNGYPLGQMRIEKDFTVKNTVPKIGLTMAQKDEQAVTYAHYDHTAVDRSSVG